MPPKKREAPGGEETQQKASVVLYRVLDPKGGGVLPKGGPYVKQIPRKGVLNFLEDPHPRIL